MLRWTSPRVVPPYVAKPLELLPFRAVMLAPTRVGDPASARALARPYRDVADAPDRSGSSAATRVADARAGPLPARVHRRRPHRPRPRRRPRACPTRGRHVGRPRGVAARGDPPRAGRRAGRRGCTQMDLNPAPILLVHHGSQRAPRPRRRGRTRRRPTGATSTAPASDSASGRSRDAGRSTRIGDARLRDSALPPRRRPPPVRRLPPTPGGAPGHRRGTPASRCWSTRSTLPCSSAPSTARLPASSSTRSSRRRAPPAPRSTRHDRDSRRSAPSTAPHLVLTDGDAWHAVTPRDLDREAAVSWLHDRVLPRLPTRRAAHRAPPHRRGRADRDRAPRRRRCCCRARTSSRSGRSWSRAGCCRRRRPRSSRSRASACSCGR